MLHDIRNRTPENLTECVNRVGADALVPLQARDLRWTNPKGVYQFVLGHAFFFHHFPEIIVNNRYCSRLDRIP